jgi:hypothetical protein
MKFSLKKILGNKYMPFLLLGVIFLGIVLLLGFYKIKEGFDSSIGEYEYLAPIPPNTTWSQDTQTAFTNAWNTNPTTKGATLDLNIMMQEVTEEEAEYFIANGKFPWGSYITNAVQQIPNVTQQIIDMVQTMNPTRQLYRLDSNFLQTESKQTPAPLSYQIYMGTAQPPSDSTSSSDPTSSTDPTDPSDPTYSTDSTSSQSNVLSNSNYQSLTSICKNILGQN